MNRKNPANFFPVPLDQDNINLTPLFAAYRDFIALHECWLQKEITDAELQLVWKQLGEEQKHLPEKVKKHFSEVGEGWNALEHPWLVARADAKKPEDCQAYDFKRKQFVSIFLDGMDYTLVRRKVYLGKDVKEMLTIGDCLNVNSLEVELDYLKLLSLCKKLRIDVGQSSQPLESNLTTCSIQ